MRRDANEVPCTSCFQVGDGDIDHAGEAEHVHRDRVALRIPCERGIVEPGSGADNEEFDIAQLLDQFSQSRHGLLRLGYIDRLDHARTRKLRAKSSQEVGAPRNDADAIPVE